MAKTRRRHYYLAINSYSTESSIGFSNTWRVLVYKTRTARDVAFDEHSGLGIKKITKKEISRYMSGRPSPFTGQRFCIFWYDEEEGQVVVEYPDDCHEPLYG